MTAASDGSQHVRLGDVWTGTRVGFDALQHGNLIFFAYYDPDRWMTIGQFDKSSGSLCQIRLASRFAGWDSHNALTLALDGQNRLHVTGNMHASPLVYAHTAVPLSIKGLQLEPVAGRDETHATYPTFLQGPNHSLLLAYRSGHSGDGVWILDGFVDDHWERQSDALFIDHDEKGPISAYPRFNLAADGALQAVVVWRRSKDASDNFAVSYTETTDSKFWKRHDGKVLPLPMTPASDAVETLGAGKGLLNSARVTKDPLGQPILTYTRFDDKGLNAIFAAKPSSQGWTIAELVEAKQRSDIAGGGSISAVPGFNDLRIDPKNGLGTFDVRFPGEAAQELTLDTHDLSVNHIGAAQAQDDQAKLKSRNAALSDLRLTELQDRVDAFLAVRNADTEHQSSSPDMLYWQAQATHRDRPRACTTEAPHACDPPSAPLILIMTNGVSAPQR